MGKKVLGIIVVIVFLAGGALVFSAINKGEMPIPSSQSTMATSNPSSTNVQGSYVDYSEDVIAKTAGTKILFFHAPWCPQCRDLDASIKQESVPAGVTIIKVDYDSNQKLRQQYEVMIQTTLVKVDDQGNLIKKYVAYDEPNLASVKRNLL